MRCQLASSMSSKGCTSVIPALATRTSRPPNRSTQRSTARRTSRRREISPVIPSTAPPPEASAWTVSSTRPASQSRTQTFAPSTANRSAVARPIPCPDPVTSTTLPENLLMPSPPPGAPSEHRPNVDDDAVPHDVENVVQIDRSRAIARYQFDALPQFQPAVGVHVENGVLFGNVTYLGRFTHNPRRCKIDPDRLLAAVEHDRISVSAGDRRQHGQAGLEVRHEVGARGIHKDIGPGLQLGHAGIAARQIKRAGTTRGDNLHGESGRPKHVRDRQQP